MGKVKEKIYNIADDIYHNFIEYKLYDINKSNINKIIYDAIEGYKEAANDEEAEFIESSKDIIYDFVLDVITNELESI